jgi:catechol 2,3-dioxygenase-like lactoylglutathione lyase family enzyme
MAVHDVSAAADFYGKILAFSNIEDETLGPWRMFQTQGMTFELFQAHPTRSQVLGWGKGQAFRPVILVPDLSAAMALLQQYDIAFSRSQLDGSPQIEMVGPEGIRWAFRESPTIQMDWAHPVIAGVELKAAHLQAQKEFYTQILGMRIEAETDHSVHLTQTSGDAWLHIEAGGTATPLRIGEPRPAFFHPVWISYETRDVKQANTWLLNQDVTILRPLTYHPDWHGTDILLADADGNVVQVVQAGKVESLVSN